jgi:NAD(P)-dependent dehydrogenase (short-subunit alcohol dehydrogenase family)
MKDLSGRVAVVTGAASGIGRALAERFAAEGMKVALADVEEEPLEAVCGSLRGRGAEALSVRTDVSRSADVEALAEQVVRELGAVHLVCNNAGVASGGLCWEVSEHDWSWVLGVNLWGVIHGLRSFVPRIMEQGEGHVVNTASMAGLVSAPGTAPYNVSKHGVVTLSETLQRELTMMGSPVGVSVLCPGWVNTRIHEADRNRPGTAGQPNPLYENVRELMRQTVGAGMPPADVAGLVVDAVRQQRFYVLTHPDWKPMVAERMEDVLEERSPSSIPFPT